MFVKRGFKSLVRSVIEFWYKSIVMFENIMFIFSVVENIIEVILFNIDFVKRILKLWFSLFFKLFIIVMVLI